MGVVATVAGGIPSAIGASAQAPRSATSTATSVPSAAAPSATPTASTSSSSVGTAPQPTPGPEPIGNRTSGYHLGKSVEDPARENATTIVYANPDGSYTSDDFDTAVNYQDPATGQCQRIHPALTTGAEAGIHNTAGPVQETFVTSTSDTDLLTLAKGGDIAVLGMPAGLAQSTGSVNGDTVTFANVAPNLSVDTKKKELISNYANGGSGWALEGEPERVNVHDFKDPALGEYAKATPYKIYDLANNEG